MVQPAPRMVQPAPLSSADIRRYQRQLEEGFDLPDPRYLQWKESTLSTLPQKDPQSGCQAGTCGHPRPDSGLDAKAVQSGITVFVQEYDKRTYGSIF